MQIVRDHLSVDTKAERGQAKEIQVEGGSISSSKDYQKTLDPIAEALKISAPSWPLQNTVAVNPFWNLRKAPVYQVFQESCAVLHTPMLMPLSYYGEKLRSGEITRSALQSALEHARPLWPELPAKSDDFLHEASRFVTSIDKVKAFAEIEGLDRDWNKLITHEVGKYAAAYFDDRQMLAHFPRVDQSFWRTWCSAQTFDRSMETAGCPNFREAIETLQSMTAAEAIRHMLTEIGLFDIQAQTLYLRRLVVGVLGWMSQFKYVEWQSQLGYATKIKAQSEDLLAVRLAYDYGLLRAKRALNAPSVASWRKSLESSVQGDPRATLSIAFLYVLQLAAEFSYQKKIASKLSKSPVGKLEVPIAQMAFCIDVRSEMLRRNIEFRNNSIQTIGFAGFFGVPIDYKKLDESDVGHRLPVLLTPAYSVYETSKSNSSGPQDTTALTETLLTAYYRNLRKSPLSSFVYVELFGVLYIAQMLRQTLRNQWSRWFGRALPERFNDKKSLPSSDLKSATNLQRISEQERIDRAEAVLRHMGLVDVFSDLIWIVGHGSETINNAFRSGLDCGACGGHAGDINARVLVQLLNDPAVRNGLKSRGLVIPDKTWFVAAIHETVTDEIYLLDDDLIPESKTIQINEIQEALRQASAVTRQERMKVISPVLDKDAERRARNWSEIRPEWGLTGNACFIVAPRARTLGVNLASRSFLHDYDWRKDQNNGFKTLELIMTAPMVVTNWINMQYYSSSVAPQIFGAGNKVLHNLTNETGVVEGNGGDLRVGLPLQSVHDGQKLVHEPLRLSVYIEAPQDEIEKIIAQHETVRELVDNGWLHLLHIDPQSGLVRRRLNTNVYEPVTDIVH